MRDVITYLALIRYWAALIVSGVPVMVTLRSATPSSALAILMVAPDICLKIDQRIRCISKWTDIERVLLISNNYLYESEQESDISFHNYYFTKANYHRYHETILNVQHSN